MRVTDRIKHAWSAFTGDRDDRDRSEYREDYGVSSSYRPDKARVFVSNERSIISAIQTRMSIDVASPRISHVKQDVDGRYESTVKSGLNNCLNVEANIDQGGSHFRQDMALTLLDKGVIAIVPTETDLNPKLSGGYDIRKLRVGTIVSWYPQHVKVSLYNENTAQRVEKVFPKRMVAIVENPFYAVMNEPNSVLQRIVRKLQLLDAVDEAASSGKLDLIIQLPYVIKSDARQDQAEKRRNQIETQLKGSKYGIAYTDGTEKITQLNRPAENNMLKQIEYLMGQLYSQLGADETIFRGTADEATMLNYHNRTIDPILRAITEAIARTFLTKTARSQGQTIDYIRDPFKLVPIRELAELGDKFLRNEVVTSNEMRSAIGLRPSKDPKADKLVNSNMPQPETTEEPTSSEEN